eukprot:jgi/Psemu1/197219/e_gw1.200.58.1
MVSTKKSSPKSTGKKARGGGTAAKKKSKSGGGKMASMPCSDRIVLAIASRQALGEAKPLRDTIMGLALITNKNSFNTTISNIKKKDNWVEYDKDSIWLTEDGKDYVGPGALSVPQTNDAMQDKIRTEMVKGQKPRQIFDAMLDGGWHSREELAETLNLPNNNSFGTYISALRKVVTRDNKKIRLADFVFPCGRP